jgi:hypothetical protein
MLTVKGVVPTRIGRRGSNTSGVGPCTYARRMTTRQFVLPQAGDDLSTLAARELPGVADAVQQLLSWNLHLAARRSVGLLPSDIVFTEPPPAR